MYWFLEGVQLVADSELWSKPHIEEVKSNHECPSEGLGVLVSVVYVTYFSQFYRHVC